ncbi:Permease of the drug/metabolite transporter (DMT) superfamily [[Clostridium] ultunense Esp]|uniref:Permease of the drug/metabolite transporter (DMT) superfamily n=1 Tax=[Clostridium] ultunense Esp TaxID=1288971 RepID=M1ZFF7_9FIRM|nr:DMT family transporter [Schnuerera ultunensis]CCQ97074.1 Permease of the drug/metabolite transporter (DMT) superfamily [[Clostridium] ultunense Esp]SHD78304.1 Permease of the drug/metabolite transporter (DMT) superfamily [[Clostridium] ultunense Esp]
MKDRSSIYADLSLLIVAIIWGSGFIVTKNSLNHITPYYLLAFRFMISFLLMSLVFFKRLKKAKLKDWKAGFLIGIFLFAGFATQTVGLKYTTVGKQAFITASNVVMVPFIYWAISKKKPDIYDVIAVFLCFTGIGILSFESNLRLGYGEFLTFICAIFFAFHIATIGYFSKEHDPIVLSVIQILVAGILSTIFALLLEPKIGKLSNETLFSILYLAVFSTLIAFLVQNVAQKYTSSTHAAIILSLEAVFGGIMSLIFLKEPFTIRFLIGCISILISILTTETKWSFLRKRLKGNGDSSNIGGV